MEYYPDFPEDEEQYGVVRLSRVTYELADGQPDAMGWKAVDVEGIGYGTVSDLLADAMTGQIVFVAIRHDDSGRTALVPVEGVYLDMTARVLILPVRDSDLRDCPDFTDDVVDLMPYVTYWLQRTAV